MFKVSDWPSSLDVVVVSLSS